VGQIVSGLLLEYFSWQSIFWVVVPVVVLALVAGAWLVPTSRDPEHAPLDVVGSLLSVAGLGGLLYAIIEAPNAGLTSGLSLGVGAASLLFIALFVWWERRSRHPMLPVEFFREGAFTAGNIVLALVFFYMFATFFVVTQYLQFVQDFSPVEAGVRFLPLGVGLIVGAPNSARLVARFSAMPVIIVGLLLMGSAFASFALLQVEDPNWRIGSTFFVAGLGMGLSMTPATTLIMTSIPARKAGIGSSMNDTSREVGGAFGVAILGTILKASYVSRLEDAVPTTLTQAQRAAAETGLGGALAVAAAMGPDGAMFANAAREAFVGAMAPAFWTAVATVAATAVFVIVFFPRSSTERRASTHSGFDVDTQTRQTALRRTV